MVAKILPALEKFLASLELDEGGEFNAALARSLAQRLDDMAHSESGAMAMATAGIAKELRAVVEAITEANAEDTNEFVADLFT